MTTAYERHLKRAVDLVLASAGLLLLWPLLLLVALAIRLEDGGPAIFRQQRVGQNRSLFTLLKFRSMPLQTPELPSAAATGLKVTRVGGVIRRTKVDELPQLFNVLVGDMSMVGPRPALPVQSRLLQLRSLAAVDRVRPGLTGLAQINGYEGMPEHEKVAWERRYVARLGIWPDIWIILQTIGYLRKRPPVY